MTTKHQQYRQGDVLILPAHSIPDTARPVPCDKGRVVLAYGEVTGHAHAIKASGVCSFYKEGGNADMPDGWLEITGGKPVELRHEEHDTIDLPPGRYRVVRQREWNAGAVRRVAD